MSSRVAFDGSVLGHTLWGGMEDVTGIATSGRSRIANGFTGGTVFSSGCPTYGTLCDILDRTSWLWWSFYPGSSEIAR